MKINPFVIVQISKMADCEIVESGRDKSKIKWNGIIYFKMLKQVKGRLHFQFTFIFLGSFKPNRYLQVLAVNLSKCNPYTLPTSSR